MLKTTSNLESAAMECSNQLKKVLMSGRNENFLEGINSADEAILSKALLIKYPSGDTLLHYAEVYAESVALITLLKKVSVDALSDALMVKNNSGYTPMHGAAFTSNEEFFIAVIQNMSVDTLSNLMLARDNNGVTPFHQAAKFQTSVALITLIEKIGIDAFSTALLVADHYGGTPLHDAAEYNSENFIPLIQNTSVDVLSTALLMQNSNGYTPLHYAAMNLNPQEFNAIIETLSVDTLSAALVVKDKNGDTPLHKVAKKPNPAGLIASINKVNDQTIPAIAVILKECNVTSQNVMKALLSRCDTVLGLSLFDNDKMSGPLKNFLSDSAFNPNHADIHHRFFSNKFASECLDRIWRKIKSGNELLPGLRLRMQLMTVLMAKPAFSLTEDEIDFFRYLKKITSEHQDKIDTLIHHHLENRPLSSMLLSRDNNRVAAYINLLKTEPAQIPDLVLDEVPDDEVPDLVLKIRNNEILIKIIAPEHHAQYMAQLQDYNFRPTLRETIIAPKYKLVHLTGQVVDYEYHRHKNKPPYTHTKKSSATLLSSTLSTPVFGQHAPNRPLVGYLFNKKDCVIKAMLRQDKGTYKHQWLTQTEEEAKNAAHLIPNYNFTDESAFLNEINTDSSRTNEVLVKVKKEAIVAIVIARKDSNSISIAKERQNEARDKLGLDLPIVFYDSNNGVLEMVQEKWGNLTQSPKNS